MIAEDTRPALTDILAGLPHVDARVAAAHSFRAQTHFPIFEAIGHALSPRSIVEIGAGQGFSLISMLRGARNVARISFVDNESALHGSNGMCVQNLSAYIDRFDRRETTISLDVLKHRLELLRIKKAGPIDLLHIDGDETVEGCLNDLLATAALAPRHLIVSSFHSSDNVKQAVIYWAQSLGLEFFVVNSYRGLAFFDFTQEQQARRLLENAGVPLRREIRDLENRTGARKGRCWCGGSLGESVSPLYGTCASCGTLVLTDEFSEDELKQFYSFNGYWHDYVQGDKGYPTIEQRAEVDFRDRIPKWYAQLKKHAPSASSILEIGCAHGGFLAYCRDRGAAQLVGVEVDESTCAFARSRFGLPHIISGLFPDIELPLERFDAITGFDVLEHIADPVRALRAVRALIEPAGICLFQIPCYRGEGADWMQMKREHVFLYNEQSIGALFERAGLRLVEIGPGFNPDEICVVGTPA